MSKNMIKAIPYGVTDYEAIRKDGAYYVDKTMFLEKIEKAGKYLFFIRPRRFGKSLMLSVMESYYDILKADRFDLFYKGTYVHQNATSEKNSYLVLNFNFSAVAPNPEQLESFFLDIIRTEVNSFLCKYREYLEPGQTDKLIDQLADIPSASNILLHICNLCKSSNRKLYIIVDEYDNFTNTILTTSGSGAYETLTHGEGFFRAFFNSLKKGTTGSDAPISRLFITGVSPVTLDDVTSGFNIGKNISIKPVFNRMLGFTKQEVTEMIDYYRGKGLIKDSNRFLLDLMSQWYNNYSFSTESQTRVFNSDMVLYFLDEYMSTSQIPGELIDRNVRIDYGKLRHLIIIDKDRGKLVNGNFSRLKQIIEEGEIATGKIVKGFPVDKLTNTENFVSLLFYFGLLTIKEVIDDEPVLQIPNETARRTLHDCLKEIYQEMETSSLEYIGVA